MKRGTILVRERIRGRVDPHFKKGESEKIIAQQKEAQPFALTERPRDSRMAPSSG